MVAYGGMLAPNVVGAGASIADALCDLAHQLGVGFPARERSASGSSDVPTDKLSKLVELFREADALMEDEAVREVLNILGFLPLTRRQINQFATDVQRLIDSPPTRCPACHERQRHDDPPIRGCVRCDTLICSWCALTGGHDDPRNPGLCGSCWALVRERDASGS